MTLSDKIVQGSIDRGEIEPYIMEKDVKDFILELKNKLIAGKYCLRIQHELMDGIDKLVGGELKWV